MNYLRPSVFKRPFPCALECALPLCALNMVTGFVSPAFGEETHSYLIGLNNWEVTLLGTLGGGYSIGNGINNAGQVVGYSLTAPGQRMPLSPAPMAWA